MKNILWTYLRRLGLSAMLALSLSLIAGADVQVCAQSSPFWGNLKPGPYAVGFKTIRTYDYSRAIKPKVERDGKVNAQRDQRAMPMLISIWYPAVKNPTGVPMTFEQCLYASQEVDAAALTAEQKQEISRNWKDFYERPFNFPYGKIADESWQQLLKTKAAAVPNAQAARGSFPLILGEGDASAAFTLDEFLASHGYVVARVKGRAASTPLLYAEGAVRNLEYALGLLHDQPGVDPNRLGIIGMSAAGFPIYLLPMRNTEVDAAVVMDSIIFVPSIASSLKATPYFDLTKFRAPLLYMDRAESVKSADFADFDAIRYATRYHFLLNYEPLLHQDYSQHGASVTHVLKLRGKDQAAAEQAFELIYQYVLHFFDAHVKKEPAGLAFLNRKPEENGARPGFLTFEAKAALPAPPSEAEFMTLLQQPNGVSQAVTVYHEATRADPSLRLFQEGMVNGLGFQFLQSHRIQDAIEVFKLNVEAYPNSIQALNTLGNAYRDSGQKQLAIQCFEKVLEMIAQDTQMNASEKAQSKNNIQQKINQLKEQK